MHSIFCKCTDCSFFKRAKRSLGIPSDEEIDAEIEQAFKTGVPDKASNVVDIFEYKIKRLAKRKMVTSE